MRTIRKVALGVVVLTGVTQAAAAGFINVPGRADIAFDTAHDILYVSGTDALRRYDMNTGQFLSSIVLGGQTLGMDISPDGSTLAVANTSRTDSTTFVDLINLNSGASSRVNFNRAFYEGGTFSVAFDAQNKLLVSSRFEGSGWVPLRQYDLASHSTIQLGEVRQNSMLSASADRSVVAVAEANISDGSWGYYRTGDTSYASQHQGYEPVTGGTSWFNFEIGVSRDGNQFAIPTYGGTFIGDAAGARPLISGYAGIPPIGVGYSPVSDRVFLPFGNTNILAEYDTETLTEVGRFSTPGTFDWTGNQAFGEGRTKVAADGSYVFSTLDDGVYFAALSPVPEPSLSALMLAGGLLLLGVARRRRMQG